MKYVYLVVYDDSEYNIFGSYEKAKEFADRRIEKAKQEFKNKKLKVVQLDYTTFFEVWDEADGLTETYTMQIKKMVVK